MSDSNGVIKEYEHDNCFWGYMGAILGALVWALPWVLIKVFANVNVLFLSLFLPIGAVRGYKHFKGIVNKNTFKTIVIISIIATIVTAVYVIPIAISSKNGYDLIEYWDTKENTSYFKDILDQLEIGIVGLAVGCFIAYCEIQILLNRYKNTNETIKDTNTFIRADNTPIDSNEFNSGIKIFEKKESYKSLNKSNWFEEMSKLQNQMQNQNHISSKYAQHTYNENVKENGKKENQKASNAIIIIVIVIFIMLVMNMIFEGDNNHYYEEIIDNYDTIENTIDYDSYNSYEEEYKTYIYSTTAYSGEKKDILFDYPSNWSVISKSKNLIIFESERGHKKLVVIYDKDEHPDYDTLSKLHESVSNDIMKRFNGKELIDGNTVNENGIEYTSSYFFDDEDNAYTITSASYEKDYIVFVGVDNTFAESEKYIKMVESVGIYRY